MLTAVPGLYAMLRDSGISTPASPVVIFHDPKAPRANRYGVRTLNDATWRPATRFDARKLVEPLREVDRWYHERDRTPPAVFIAIDLRTGHAWNGHTLEAIQKGIDRPHFDAVTLAPVAPAGEGLPPRLSPRAQLFSARRALDLSAELGAANDRPEETFLLSEDLLRLTVDSLDGAQLLDPPPRAHERSVGVRPPSHHATA